MYDVFHTQPTHEEILELDKFIQSNPASAARPGKLESFKAEILRMHAEKFSLSRIAAFLAANDVQVSRAAIHKFIGKHAAATAPMKSQGDQL